MRRLCFALIACFLLALPLSAQEATPDLESVLATAQAAAIRAEDAAEDAERYASIGSDFLGIFESVGTAIGVLTGVVVPLVLGIAGFIGWRGLGAARAEVEALRKQVEGEVETLRESLAKDLRDKQAELDALRGTLTKELRDKQAELDEVKAELQESAQDERLRSNQATLALSLLPLAERQYRVKDYAGALDTYQQALGLDPDNMVIHYRLGYVYTQMKKLDEATHHLDHVLRLDPNFAPALANLGYVLRLRAEKLPQDDTLRGQLMAEAEMKLRQALEISPKLVDEDGESWWGVLGGLHRRRGQVDDAIRAYLKALDVTPHASYPLGNLALLYMQKNDRDKMIETYRRVERIAAQNARVEGADMWAWADWLVAQMALGHFDEAQYTLDGLIAATPVGGPDQLKNPLATLKQLASLMGDAHAAKMQPFIERIEARISANGQD